MKRESPVLSLVPKPPKAKWPATPEEAKKLLAECDRLIANLRSLSQTVSEVERAELDMKIRRAVPFGEYEHLESTPSRRIICDVISVARFGSDDYYVACIGVYGPDDSKLFLEPLVGPNAFLLRYRRLPRYMAREAMVRGIRPS